MPDSPSDSSVATPVPNHQPADPAYRDRRRFTVRLSDARPDRCNAVHGDDRGCPDTPTLIATLLYCNCGEAHMVHEACPLGATTCDPDLVPVCEWHGAAVRSWECFRRLTTYTAQPRQEVPSG